MILHIDKKEGKDKVDVVAQELKAFVVEKNNEYILITSSSLKEVPAKFEPIVKDFWVFDNDMQLASKKYLNETRKVNLGNVTIGGDTNNMVLIGGPCSVESEKQIIESSELLKELGLKTLRGGCYKPRTSPYSFQGLGFEGLMLLKEMKAKFGHTIITEVRDATHVQDVIEHSDIIQIGAKAMYDQGILRACAEIDKPVLLKRGFGTTLQEFVQAAEFMLSGGNENVILCERGIRTFETKTRFTLDLCGVAYLQEFTNLPIILDPSHAMGYDYGVTPLAKACAAMGVDGLIIETHPTPKLAKSDAAQQLTHDGFKQLKKEVEIIANAIGYNIV